MPGTVLGNWSSTSLSKFRHRQTKDKYLLLRSFLGEIRDKGTITDRISMEPRINSISNQIERLVINHRWSRSELNPESISSNYFIESNLNNDEQFLEEFIFNLKLKDEKYINIFICHKIESHSDDEIVLFDNLNI